MIRIDYCTINFTDKFTVKDFTEFAERAKIVDADTGEILERNIDSECFQLNYQYGKSYASVWGIDSEVAAKLAKEKGLAVSRLDLANDIKFEDVETTFEQWYKQAETWHDREKPTAMFGMTKGRKKKNNGDKQFIIGSSSSNHQLSVYKKRWTDEDEESPTKRKFINCIRVELQLRTIDAKAAFDIAANGDFSQKALKLAFDSAWNRYYPDCLPLQEIDEKAFLDIPKDTRQSGRKDWFYTQVLQSAITHFDTTGENLAQFLLDEFNKHYELSAKEAASVQNLRSKNLYRKRLAIIENKIKLDEQERHKKAKRGIKSK